MIDGFFYEEFFGFLLLPQGLSHGSGDWFFNRSADYARGVCVTFNDDENQLYSEYD